MSESLNIFTCLLKKKARIKTLQKGETKECSVKQVLFKIHKCNITSSRVRHSIYDFTKCFVILKDKKYLIVVKK